MVEITDITKLRPELQTISDAELERRETEIQMEKERRRKEREAVELKKQAEVRNALVQQYIDITREMHKHGYLHPEAVAVYTTKGGQFLPHLKYKQAKV